MKTCHHNITLRMSLISECSRPAVWTSHRKYQKKKKKKNKTPQKQKKKSKRWPDINPLGLFLITVCALPSGWKKDRKAKKKKKKNQNPPKTKNEIQQNKKPKPNHVKAKLRTHKTLRESDVLASSSQTRTTLLMILNRSLLWGVPAAIIS